MNQDFPLVSVCIPTFQHVDYIAECLESVLNQQTTFPFEVIVGEDESDDGTRKICEEYAAKYPDRIRLFLRKTEDKIFLLGRKSGRANYLENFKAAKGKYIAVLDGDDCWLTTDKLQKQVELLELHPEAFLCTTDFCTGENVPASTASKKSDSLQFTYHAQCSLRQKSYAGHVSNWFFRNELQDFIASPIAIKAPILDLLLFAFFKEKGGMVHLEEPTSLYRTNRKSYHVQKSVKSNVSELFWSSWYQFIYLHRSPIKFLHFLGFLGKKILRDKKNT